MIGHVCELEPNCFHRGHQTSWPYKFAGNVIPLFKNRTNSRLWNYCPSEIQSSEKYVVWTATRASLILNSWQTKWHNYPKLIFLQAEFNLLWCAPSLRMIVALIQAFWRVVMPLMFLARKKPPLLPKIIGVFIYWKLVSSRLILFSSLTNKVKQNGPHVWFEWQWY